MMRIKIKCKSCGTEPKIRTTPKETWLHCIQHPLCQCGGTWDIVILSRDMEDKE